MKKLLVEALIKGVGDAAINHAEACNLKIALAQADAAILNLSRNIDTLNRTVAARDTKIGELIHHNELTQCELNAHERALKSLHDAGFAALKKLKINSPERVALSHAIQAADTIMIPF